MTTIEKLVRGGDDRRTRLHTRRGAYAPLTEVARVPLLLAERLRGVPPRGPWMARGAVRRLEELLLPDMSLLELGSGSSTAWYAERVATVTSIEPDARWARRTRALVDPTRVQVVVGPVAEVAPDLLRQNRFDVVIVDHSDEPSFSRVDALAFVGARVQAVVLDDSDRRQYESADRIMATWSKQRFVSYKAQPLLPAETTLYRRELP